jgi:hypothetical protein
VCMCSSCVSCDCILHHLLQVKLYC